MGRKTTEHYTLGRAVGEQLRTIREREGWRQEEVADLARETGLTWWRPGTVATLESGHREDLTFSEAVLLAVALDLHPGELIPATSTPIELSEGAYAPGEDLRRLLLEEGDRDRTYGLTTLYNFNVPTIRDRIATAKERNQLRQLWPNASREQTDRVLRGRFGEAERKAAARLDTDPLTIAVAAVKVWGQTLAEERDARLDPEVLREASPTRLRTFRGHVTRELLEELRPAVERLRPKTAPQGKESTR